MLRGWLILLLWAHPLNKIVMLRHEHIITPEGMLLKLGTTPATIPAAITEIGPLMTSALWHAKVIEVGASRSML